jgi:DNA-directed RNA polymerase subunit H
LAKSKTSKKGGTLEVKSKPKVKAPVEESPPQKVTDHKLVPKHEILSHEQKVQVLSQYNATEDQFPFLFNTDAVVKEIGAKPGDMVRIIRPSDTAGETIYYRYVVEAV